MTDNHDHPPRDVYELLARLRRLTEEDEWRAVPETGGDGSVGVLLEEHLGIDQTGVPYPDFQAYELKTALDGSSGTISLFAHEPRGSGLARRLVERFGWPLDGRDERGLYTTLTSSYNGRGFRLDVDRASKHVVAEYDPARVDSRFEDWKESVPEDFSITPYWTFLDIRSRLRKKMRNLIVVPATTRTRDSRTLCQFRDPRVWRKIDRDAFLSAFEEGWAKIQFQVRSGKNYGTRFVVPKSRLTDLYEKVTTIDDEGILVTYRQSQISDYD